MAEYLLAQADARRLPLPDNSVHCVVTSPPYYRQRNYGVAGQIGLEKTVEAYVDEIVTAFREVRRVLRLDGTCWLNIDDKYASGGHGGHHPRERHFHSKGSIPGWQSAPEGFRHKDMLLLPARVAIALQDDGWYVRADVIWSKDNPKPESCKDRPTRAHEYVYLLAKSPTYFFDYWAIRELQSQSERRRRLLEKQRGLKGSYILRRDELEQVPAGQNGVFRSRQARQAIAETGLRNRRSVWTMPTQRSKVSHFATFPVWLADQCIKASTPEAGVCATCGAPWKRTWQQLLVPGSSWNGSKEHRAAGVYRNHDCEREYIPPVPLGWSPSCRCNAAARPALVLDPFAGTSTTGVSAGLLGRHYVGSDLSAQYLGWSRERLDKLGWIPSRVVATA